MNVLYWCFIGVGCGAICAKVVGVPVAAALWWVF